MKYLVGVGNYNMYDDSIGIRLIEHIADNYDDSEFKILDLSGNAIDVLAYFNSPEDKMLIIDTAMMKMKPGEYRFFKPENIKSEKKLALMSNHEGDVAKIITLGLDAGLPMPEITIMGIQPDVVKEDFGLSDTMTSNFDEYVRQAIDYIRKL